MSMLVERCLYQACRRHDYLRAGRLRRATATPRERDDDVRCRRCRPARSMRCDYYLVADFPPALNCPPPAFY